MGLKLYNCSWYFRTFFWFVFNLTRTWFEWTRHALQEYR